MAKAKDLAALAGLAGLAYAMRNKDNKDQGMTPKQNDDLATANRISKMSEDSDTLARVNRNMSPGQSAADDINAGVLKALTTPKTAPNDQAGNQGVLSPKSLTPKPAVAKQAPSDRREMESGMSRGTRPANPRNLEAGMSRGTRPADPRNLEAGMSRGRRMASGGMTASSRADGIATKGKTRGKIC
jgi:hypothetical protein